MEARGARTLGTPELQRLVHRLVPALAVCLRGLLNINQVAHSFALIFLLLIELVDVAWRELGCAPSVGQPFLGARLAEGTPRRTIPSATLLLLLQGLLDALKSGLRAGQVRITCEKLTAPHLAIAGLGPLLLILDGFLLRDECYNHQLIIQRLPQYEKEELT